MYEKDFVFTISPFVTNWLQEQKIKPSRAQRRATERKEGGKRQLLTRRVVAKGRYFSSSALTILRTHP